MTRRWPIPVRWDRTFHLVGDLHHGGGVWNTRRKDVMREDIERVTFPQALARIQVGDFVNNGFPAEDTEGFAYMDSLSKSPVDYLVIGNHDFLERTRLQAAAAWGLGPGYYEVDFGFVRMLVLSPEQGGVLPAEQFAWMDDRLLAADPQPCFIVCHWPMFETVAMGDITKEFTTTESPFYMKGDAEIRAILTARPNAKAWISGHTHTSPGEDTLIVSETLAGRNFHHINCSAPAYVGRTSEPFDPLTTLPMTWLDDRIEVRFRNHGGVCYDGNLGVRVRTLTL